MSDHDAEMAAVLAEARTIPCSLCKGTGIFEYDSNCGDSTCDAPHPTRRVECRTCRGEGTVPIGIRFANACLAALSDAGYAVVNRDDLRETLAHLDAACRSIGGENCTASFVQRLQQQAVAR